jgi:hypothetical protein
MKLTAVFTAIMAMTLQTGPVCLAQERITQSSSFRLGTVDIGWVRSHARANSDASKAEAEILEKEVEEAKQRIRAYEAQGASKAQIETFAAQESDKLLPRMTDVQWQLGQPKIAAFNEEVTAVIRAIAEDRDLDLVVEKSSVYAVQNRFEQRPLDVTAELCRRLNLPEPPKTTGTIFAE